MIKLSWPYVFVSSIIKASLQSFDPEVNLFLDKDTWQVFPEHELTLP